MRKTLTALAVSTLALVAVAAPAHATAPSDLSDVRYLVAIGKAAWGELDYSDQENICSMWYIDRTYTRDAMAEVMRDSVDDYVSVYDSKRAAYRLLNWAC